MKSFLALKLSDVVFILLINVKMPLIVVILTFISRVDFNHLVKHEDFSYFKTISCCIHPAGKCYNSNNCCHFNIYLQDRFHALLS